MKDLNVYPNPNNGQFNLKFNIAEKGNTEVGIYDMQGNMVYKDELQDFSGDYQKPVNLGNTQQGLYILKVTQNGKTFTRQIAIQ